MLFSFLSNAQGSLRDVSGLAVMGSMMIPSFSAE